MVVIVTYDICTKNKNNNKAFKICKKYLFRLQNSVFIGELTSVDIEKLEKELKAVLKSDDICDIIQIRNVKNMIQTRITSHYNYDKINII